MAIRKNRMGALISTIKRQNTGSMPKSARYIESEAPE